MRSKIRLSRMVGGVPSAHGMWPWQAGLYRLEKTTGEIILKYSSFKRLIPASSERTAQNIGIIYTYMRCLSPIIAPSSGTLSNVVRLTKPF